MTLWAPASSIAADANLWSKWAGFPFPICSATSRVMGLVKLKLALAPVDEDGFESSSLRFFSALANRIIHCPCAPRKEPKLWVVMEVSMHSLDACSIGALRRLVTKSLDQKQWLCYPCWPICPIHAFVYIYIFIYQLSQLQSTCKVFRQTLVMVDVENPCFETHAVWHGTKCGALEKPMGKVAVWFWNIYLHSKCFFRNQVATSPIWNLTWQSGVPKRLWCSPIYGDPLRRHGHCFIYTCSVFDSAVKHSNKNQWTMYLSIERAVDACPIWIVSCLTRTTKNSWAELFKDDSLDMVGYFFTQIATAGCTIWPPKKLEKTPYVHQASLDDPRPWIYSPVLAFFFGRDGAASRFAAAILVGLILILGIYTLFNTCHMVPL